MNDSHSSEERDRKNCFRLTSLQFYGISWMTCSAFIINNILHIDEILPLSNRGIFKFELKSNVDRFNISIIRTEAEVLASVKKVNFSYSSIFGNTKLRIIMKSKHVTKIRWSWAIIKKMVENVVEKRVIYSSILYFIFSLEAV